MAIVEPYMEKVVENSTLLEYIPDPGRAIIVKNLIVEPPDEVTHVIVTAKTRGTLVFWGGNSHQISMLGTVKTEKIGKHTIFDMAREMGLEWQLPVPQGAKFVVETDVAAMYIKIEYEIRDAADVAPDLPNGPAATTLYYTPVLTNSADITTAGYNRLDLSPLPVEFPAFPAEPCPSNTRITLYAIIAHDVEHNAWDGTADHFGRTLRYRLTKGRTVLFDEEARGFICKGAGATSGSVNTAIGKGYSQIPVPSTARPVEWFFLPEPIVFEEGEELNIDVEVELDDANALLPANMCSVGFIAKMEVLRPRII